MATFSYVLEGVLGAQISRLAPDKTRLTGPGNQIVIPGELLFDYDVEQQFRNIGEVDIPGYQRDEIVRPQPFAQVTFNLSAAIDAETLALFGAVNGYGQNGHTYGIETLCEALACFCDPTDESFLEIVVFACARACKNNGFIVDPLSGNTLNGVVAFPCMQNIRISDFPGLNRPGEDPDPWTITGTAYGNPNFGTGPGGVMLTDDPDGITCWMARGLTDVPVPVDCDFDCLTFPHGYDSNVLALT